MLSESAPRNLKDFCWSKAPVSSVGIRYDICATRESGNVACWFGSLISQSLADK